MVVILYILSGYFAVFEHKMLIKLSRAGKIAFSLGFSRKILRYPLV